jgi:thymidylate synthase (FAD)
MSRERAEKQVDMQAELPSQARWSTSASPSHRGVSPRFSGSDEQRTASLSYSVQSQRYVRRIPLTITFRPSIAADPEAAEEFERAMNAASESYERLAAILEKKIAAGLTASGIDEEKAHKQAEKQAIEDARFVLPNACDTKMIVTMNARSLRNFFRLRCCKNAQWEIALLRMISCASAKRSRPPFFAKLGPPARRAVSGGQDVLRPPAYRRIPLKNPGIRRKRRRISVF